jgi:hypothetical protein
MMTGVSAHFSELDSNNTIDAIKIYILSELDKVSPVFYFEAHDLHTPKKANVLIRVYRYLHLLYARFVWSQLRYSAKDGPIHGLQKEVTISCPNDIALPTLKNAGTSYDLTAIMQSGHFTTENIHQPLTAMRYKTNILGQIEQDILLIKNRNVAILTLIIVTLIWFFSIILIIRKL